MAFMCSEVLDQLHRKQSETVSEIANKPFYTQTDAQKMFVPDGLFFDVQGCSVSSESNVRKMTALPVSSNSVTQALRRPGMWYFPQEDMRVEVQAVENWQERVMILPEPPAVDVDELTVPQKGPSMRMFSALENMSSHTHGLPCSLPDASMVSGLQSALVDKRHPHTGNSPTFGQCRLSRCHLFSWM